MKLIIEVLGWVAFALNLLGNELLGRKRTVGWPVRLVANAGWLAYSFGVFAWPLFVNHVVFAFSNARGWWKWRGAKDLAVDEVESCNTCPFSWMTQHDRFRCIHKATENGDGRSVTKADEASLGFDGRPGWCPLEAGPVLVQINRART